MNTSTTPTSFIEYEMVVIFNEANENKKGVIKSFEKASSDSRGTFVECNIVHEKGTSVVKLYDDDFDNHSSDQPWKFYGIITPIIKKLQNQEEYINYLNDFIDDFINKEDNTSDTEDEKNMLLPSSFVEPGTDVEVLFSLPGFIKGVVQEVEKRDKDSRGTFVECTILYADGELSENVKLYDKDFSTMSENCWMFKHDMNKIISILTKHETCINDIEEKIVEDDNYDDESIYSEDSEYEAIERNRKEDEEAELFIKKSVTYLKGFACFAVGIGFAVITNYMFCSNSKKSSRPYEPY